MQLFSPSHQESYTRFPNRCYFGSAPTLGRLNKDYGRGTAEEWLVYQLTDLSEFSGARWKLTASQIEQLASMLASEYNWLNVAEFMLFFRNFKMARYGTFYSSVDPMLILKVLREHFIPERYDAYVEKEQADRERERETYAKDSVTFEQYQKMKEDGSLEKYVPADLWNEVKGKSSLFAARIMKSKEEKQ